MNIVSFLERVAAVEGSAPALSLGEQLHATYGELARRVAAIAGALVREQGLQPDDRLAIYAKNDPAYIEMQLACWQAGLCVVPVNAKLHPKEVAYILADCGARLCIADDELAGPLRPLTEETRLITFEADFAALAVAAPLAMAPVAEDDPAWIFYTSGTTGRPKGATLSHRALLGMALRYYADIDQVSCADCYLHAAPISHGSGLYGLPHMMQASHIVVPASHGFDVEEIFDLMETHDNLTFFAAPTMLNRMVHHPRAATARKAALKTIYYGGAPMYLEDMKRAIATFGPCFYQVYGQGESPMTGVGLAKRYHVDDGSPRFEARLASTGLARSGVEVRILDETGREQPRGSLGEVAFRSEVTMTGYWNNPEATAAAIRDGFLLTGDVGVMDEEGFVTLKDRSKDMIISGGTNIYPREVEEVLLREPRVRAVSVVGRPDADWGEEVVAFVVWAGVDEPDPAALDRFCLENMARFKRPKHYLFLDDLPKNAYGKILKTELRKAARESNLAAAGAGA